MARRLDRLDELAATLRREHGTQVTTIGLDLTEPRTGERLLAELDARGIALTGVINNAGFGTWGPFIHEDRERLAAEIALDVVAPVDIALALLPMLQRQRESFLINVASMAAYVPSPRMAVYGATKAFVLSFTEALWAELRGTSTTVSALSPGATATEFNDVVGTENATAGARKRTPEQVVGTALRHLARRDPGPSVIDGPGNRAAAALGRLLSRRRFALAMERISDPARRR